MKNNILTIIKKEFARFFGDKRLFVTTVILPGLLIYVIYSFMGQGMMDQFTTDEDTVYEVEAQNMPSFLKEDLKKANFSIKDVDAAKDNEDKKRIKDQKLDLYVVFPDSFEENVDAYDAKTTTEAAPNVEVYYNSVSTESQSAYSIIVDALDTYEATMINKFDVNRGDVQYDMATNEDTMGKFFSMMLPFLMLTFLYSGCVAVAPESIAGEKERGTIATLLVTPMKRSHLAIGKIVSLSVIGLLSGCSSFIGTILSMPKLLGTAGAGEEVTSSAMSSAAVYRPSDYVLLLFVILTTVLVLISAISILSALAKSVKEAGTAISPLMILVMIVGVTSMMSNGAPKNPALYLIPLYNSVQCMNGIFGFNISMTNIVITIVANVVYSLLMAGILAKLFDSEKIMNI
ncbi:MAG: ABC transporter permease [Lachnospiraceae bacterium]